MKLWLFPLLFLSFLLSGASAQLRVDVALINVVATVTDDRGRYVSDLTEEDFIVSEDGERQKIAHFSFSNDLPVSMGILLDTSGSMETRLSTATAAVERFIRDTHPDDEIFLMTFSNGTDIEQDFTSDRNKLAAALRGLNASGATALYDAVYDGVRKVRKGTRDKKAILLISDGEDSTSSRSMQEALQEARRAGVLIYGLAIRGPAGLVTTPPTVPGTGRNPFPIPFPTPGRLPLPTPPTGPTGPRGTSGNSNRTNVAVIQVLAEISGGRSWVLNPESSRSQLQNVFDQIANELRNQYSIGYYPDHDLKDGKWHRIQIRTTNPRYVVRTREDYFGE
jgi:Ca-activated chloride channel family protein